MFIILYNQFWRLRLANKNMESKTQCIFINTVLLQFYGMHYQTIKETAGRWGYFNLYWRLKYFLEFINVIIWIFIFYPFITLIICILLYLETVQRCCMFRSMCYIKSYCYHFIINNSIIIIIFTCQNVMFLCESSPVTSLNFI